MTGRSRTNPRTGAVARTVDTGNSPGAVAEGAGAIWIADPFANDVVRVDDATNLVSATITVGNGPSSVAVGEGAVWIADRGDDTVVRINPDTNAITATITVGQGPAGIAAGYGAVWVANSLDGTVSRIDPSTNRVSTIPVGGSPQKIALGDRRVWVTVQPALPASSRIGGVVRIDSQGPIDFLDPALGFTPASFAIEYATCAKLLNYPDRPAPSGSRLEPEVAAAVPTPSAGGKTYTFMVRRGFRFSPPSNEPVTARTFKYSIERALSPRLKSPARNYASDIVGFSAYETGRAKHISGVTVHGNKLTIRLTDRAPDFLSRIALPFFCAVPLDTPVDATVRTVPAAGPYYVASYTPDLGAVLKLNPNYRGPRPHAAKEIDYRVGIGAAQAVREIESGQADFTAGVPSQSTAQLAKRYGPGSTTAKAGQQRYFVNPTLETTYLALNTSRPLFSDRRLRQAVNYALDRRALGRIGGLGSTFGDPTDQLLPPGMPGFHDVHIYPYTPDLQKARRLARGRGGHAVLYTCSDPQCRQIAQVIQANLKAIRIDVVVKAFPVGVMFSRIGTKGEPFDMAIVGWTADYPDPGDFLNLVDGTTITRSNNTNWSYFNDPTYNRKLTAAERLSGPKRYLAYAKLDAELARDAAPYAALWYGPEQDFFSARMGCETYQAIYGVDLAALCIRR